MTNPNPSNPYMPGAEQYQPAMDPQAAYGPPPMPATNTGWAVAALLFFWPVAFAAFNHSSRVYPLWDQGDFAGAQYASDRAKQLGKIALIVWIVLMVLIAVLYIAVFAAMMSAVGSIESSYTY